MNGRIVGGPRHYLPNDSEGWEWDVEVGDQVKVKRVVVSGTAMATDLDVLPALDTAQAIRTQGRSAIEAHLDLGEEPPDLIEFTTHGRLGEERKG